ncbi:MAG TPA: hypothetical protein VIY86_15115, partial [Pirellulaceae bacterium]
IPILHSRPEATKKIYLDFDGHLVENTAWNDFNNDLPIHAPAYSVDGDIFTFTQPEATNMTQIFNRVAEDFAPFNVDVTTEFPGAAAFTAGNTAIRALISTDVDDALLGGTGNQWYSNAGGVAFLNSWTWNDGSPVWIFENNLTNGNVKNVAEATSHEVGHALNLSHDGVSGGSSYYGGHGSGTTAWAPIMGVGYSRNLTQWSKGEYPNANQTQNDLAIIAGKLPYRVDDHANTKTNSATATALQVTGNTVSGSGVVSQTTDVDVFRLTIAGDSSVNININPAALGPNLDILAELYDASGVLVSSSNPTTQLNANFSLQLAAGTYTIAIDGTGKGDLITGYSDYGSLGQFSITGSVIALDPNPGAPFINTSPVLNDTTAPSFVTYTFSEPMQAPTFTLAQDFKLYGPEGSDLSALLQGFSFPTTTTLRVDFTTLTSAGSYRMELGPLVLDNLNNPMDQNQNGISGEIPDDVHVFQFNLTNPLVGDFNHDTVVNAADIDLLCAAIAGGTHPVLYDLTSDTLVNLDDMDYMIRTILDTEYGDANLDHVIDGSDFNAWNTSKFTSGGWAQGDFTCDGIVDGSDFNVGNQNKFTGGSRPGPGSVSSDLVRNSTTPSRGLLVRGLSSEQPSLESRRLEIQSHPDSKASSAQFASRMEIRRGEKRVRLAILD